FAKSPSGRPDTRARRQRERRKEGRKRRRGRDDAAGSIPPVRRLANAVLLWTSVRAKRSAIERRCELHRVSDWPATDEILTDVGESKAILRFSRLHQRREIGQALSGVRKSHDAIQTGAGENGVAKRLEVGAARLAREHDFARKVGVIIK